jgi:hypothetical protein
MKLANASELNRKSGEAKWKDLLCAYPPNERPASELANLPQQVVHWEPERTKDPKHPDGGMI